VTGHPEPLGGLVRAVGWASLALAGVAVVAPRLLAGTLGLRDPGASAVPVLVRLVAARQASLGLALLTRRPTPVRRSADLFLPLTALDAAAVVHGVRNGALDRRAAAAAAAVLTVNAWVARRARA